MFIAAARRPSNAAATRSRLASPLAAAALTLAFVAGSLVVGATAGPLASAEAATTPPPTATLAFDPAKNGGKTSILAGSNAVFTVTVENTDTASWFNVGVRAVVPNGIVFTPTSKLGTPVVYASGSQISTASPGSTTTTVPAGSQVWVWEDVSDLPAGAVYTADITVAPQQRAPGTIVDTTASLFPVGATVGFSVTAHASDDPTLRPIFSGSTGVRTAATLAATRTSGSVTATTRVVALHVRKDEPSPESELLRGVHNDTTVYTLTVENTSQGPTAATELVDYLPAGLEFLGCGGVDNGGVEEYPTSGMLSSTPVIVGCVTPTRVETVERTAANRAAFPAAMGADAARDGVYTKVTWNLGTLPAGAVRTVRYAAGIPLFANALFPGVQPSETGLAQAADLQNNTGASTRHSDGDGPASDGDVLTNLLTARGTYGGIVRATADRPSTDHDEEIVHAMDVRILTSVDADPTDAAPTPYTGGDGGFRTGYVAKYTLDVRAGEYTDASDIVVTDRIPNGLCPVIPAGTTVQTGDIAVAQLDGTVKHVTGAAALPAECAAGADSALAGRWADPGVSGAASVSWVAYDASTGDFYLRFTPFALAAGTSASIVYPVLMRQTYEMNAGLTSAQDRLTDTAVFTATTTTTDAASARDTTARVQSVADDSQASLSSGPASISKTVLPVTTALATGSDPCAVSGYSSTIQTGFKLGDLVCYELTVDFQPDADTRNPRITDMLPPGVTYVDSTSSLTRGGSPVAFSDNVVEPAAGGTRITWSPSAVVRDGDDFVPRGSRLVIHVWGTVSTLSANPAALDKPENLMKFQQENVHGEIFFLRASAAIEVVAGIGLVKGVAEVDGSTTLAASCSGTVPNCDHVQVEEGDAVTYRIDVSAPDFPVSGLVIWDALPAGIGASRVAPSSDYTVGAPPAGYDGPAGRSVIVWNPLSLARGESRTLEYTVSLPPQISAGATYTNRASIISYVVPTNTGTTTYRPTGSLGPDAGTNVIGGARTTNDSDVFAPAPVVAKAVVDTGITTADPDNAARFTYGETVTYAYSVTIPANTTVLRGVLKDDGVLSATNTMTAGKPYIVASPATVEYPVGATAPPGDFSFDAATGTLTFPQAYDNTTSQAQRFTVTLTVYTAEKWSDAATIFNRAAFRTSDMPVRQATASVQYTVADPTISKTVSSGAAPVVAGQDIVFSIAVNNIPGRPIAYDTVVTDCVPQQLAVASAPGATIDTTAPGCSGTLITWAVGDVASGSADRVLTYTATVDPSSAGGARYTNTASLTAYSLDGGADDARSLVLTRQSAASVTVDSAKVVKTVAPATAPIGATVTYTVDVELPIDVNFYDARIIDPAPAGVRLTGAATVSDAGTGITCEVVDNAISCVTPDNSGHILSAPTERHIVLTYSGVVVSTSTSPLAPTAGARPNNVASFAWETTPGGSTAQSVSGNARFTVVEPFLSVAKRVEGQDADSASTAVPIAPGQSRAYTVVVSSPVGVNRSTAYDVVVRDDVPATLVVDPATVTAGGVLAADGRSISWTIASIAQGATVVLGYSAVLAPTAAFTPDPTLMSTRNVATVIELYSHPDEANLDRRRYIGPANSAYVRPVFPHITVAKDTTAGDLATVGAPFSWTVTLTNTGGAVASSVQVVDTLPANWAYTATTSVSLRSGATVAPVAPSGYTFSAEDLTWTFQNLAPGDAMVVVYTATPSAAAYGDPGVGALRTVPNTNSAAVARVTDATGATGNTADTDFAAAADTADAYLVATDVTVDKTRAGTARVNAGDLVDFTLRARNVGGQTAQGVRIVDTLPAGLTFDPARVATPVTPGSGFTCTVVSDTTIDCLLTGDLAAGASEAVTVRAFALDIAPGTDSTTLTNAVEITTTTPETDAGNNRDELAVTVFAPKITVVKTGAFPAGAVGAVGEVVDYEFTVTNPVDGATLTGVAVTDAMFPEAGDITYGAWPSGVAGTLRAGQSVVASASYAITQADIDRGYVRNLASVAGTPSVGPVVTDTDTVDVTIVATPLISLEKTATLDGPTPTRAGQAVSYLFTVENTGNVTLGSVGIVDGMAGLSTVEFAPGFTGTLAPGAEVTATARYTLSQGDVDAGTLDNTATASGVSPRGALADADDTATVTIAPAPALVLEKTGAVDPAGTFTRGDRVLYAFTVRNTGTVTLAGVGVVDPMPGLSAITYVWPGQPGVLAPGAEATATAGYAMTQDDIDAGSITNTADAAGTAPDGAGTTSTDTATVKLTPKPRIGLAMTARFAREARGLVGDTVHFDYVVTNEGNMTLRGLDLTSRLVGISAMTYGPWPETEFTLAPGESVTATATYRLTVADVLAGRVQNDSRVTALAMLEGTASSVAADDAAAVPIPTLLASTGYSLVTPVLTVATLLLLGLVLLLADIRTRRRRSA